jgi:hypothetical protein
MLPYHELEYSGFRDVITGLVDRFAIAGANGAKANGARAKAPARGGAKR